MNSSWFQMLCSVFSQLTCKTFILDLLGDFMILFHERSFSPSCSQLINKCVAQSFVVTCLPLVLIKETVNDLGLYDPSHTFIRCIHEQKHQQHTTGTSVRGNLGVSILAQGLEAGIELPTFYLEIYPLYPPEPQPPRDNCSLH